jgi:predicted nuclease with TOPRIM domain
MIDEFSKIDELIVLYEHIYEELKELVDEKIIVLDEVSELYKSMEKIQARLAQLHQENDDNGEIT